MLERVETLFCALVGEDEESRERWAPLCAAAEAVMRARLAGCGEEVLAANGERVALAVAALAAVYYSQAQEAVQPDSVSAGELRVEYRGRSVNAARFCESCMAAIADLTPEDGFLQVTPWMR